MTLRDTKSSTSSQESEVSGLPRSGRGGQEAFSPEVSPAKTYPLLGEAMASKEREADYGPRWRASLASYDPETCSWKTSQRCFIEGWAEFSETWPRSGMTVNGIAYRLPPLVRLTDATGFGLLPTPRRSGQPRAWKAYKRDNYQGNLEEYLGEVGYLGWITRKFVEWMMGYPLTWTDTKASAMPSSPKSRSKS